MLLTNTTPVSCTNSTNLNHNLPSPNAELPDENSKNLIDYLHQLAGISKNEPHSIVKDHCYARPWNWKPEHVYVKPVKKLFFPKTSSFKNASEPINVESCRLEVPLPSVDLSKVQQVMDEFQRVANFVRPEEADDWEEKIDKILWSPVQNRIFNRIIRTLNSERLARLAKTNSLLEPIVRRTSIDSAAKRFRETLASANWDWRITQWLHCLLFDYLPQNYLAIYLDILQSLRQKIPQLIDKMISVQPNINSKGSWETLGSLLKKSWDPVSAALSAIKPKKLPRDPILVIVPGGISSTISCRQQKWIANLGLLGMVVAVNPYSCISTNRLTMIAGIEQLVQATRGKIQDVRADFPGRPIILVGFNTGAALAAQINLLEPVTAIVSLGFPLNTADGKRGTPDDCLLDVRCPIMFIIGQNSMLSRPDEIEDLRERLLVPTSLVIVGSADDHLRISTSKKINERINQSMVDRCIVDEIGDFIGGILLQPHPLPLRLPSMLNNYENKSKKNESRRRKNSTSSSLDSEPASPVVKKMHTQTPQNLNSQGPTSVSNAVQRNSVVSKTGTSTSTQTPRRKPRNNFVTQNYTDQIYTARLSAHQQQSLEKSTGGITLNIGSFASLSPVGPIRFEPSTIGLQSSPPGLKASGTLKTPPNTFIKVSKNNNQIISAQSQDVAKIKMIVPQKKATQRAANTYKSVNNTNNNLLAENAVLSTSAPIRINQPTASITSLKTLNPTNLTNQDILPSIHKSTGNTNSVLPTKTSVPLNQVPHGPNIVSTKKYTSATTISFSKVPAATSKVLETDSSQQHQQLQHTKTKSKKRSTVPLDTSSPKRSKSSYQSNNICSPNQGQQKTHNIVTSKSTKSPKGFQQLDSQKIQNEALTNILDLPIIIAKDSSSSSGHLSSLLYINEPEQSQTQRKYTKIILTKAIDQIDHVAPVLTKTIRKVNKTSPDNVTGTRVKNENNSKEHCR